MKVLLLVDPEIPVPPRLYGGIERVVDLLARQLVARGHDVTVFAHPESAPGARLVAWSGARSGSRLDTLRNAAQLAAEVLPRAPWPETVVHSFARLAYMTPLLPLPIAKLQTYQRAVTPRSVRSGQRLSRGTLLFTACSDSCASSGNVTGDWTTVYNGVPIERYHPTASVASDAPLVFLGRVERIKGPHTAVEVARRTGRKLVIAGNVPDHGPDVEYARALVAACDGDRVRYVGPVDDAQKTALLGSAAALLMPIEWEEPFGIVMAEALACGAPVLGLSRGSVPEVVEHGVTGLVCRDVEELSAAVGRIGELDRARCRQAAVTRFSGESMASAYERVYARALDRARGSAGPLHTPADERDG
jgi:glycosyltransferase involved in cell wall biosynthesis